MSSRPRLLDLFCGAGGAGYGYHLAGFDVTGVDIVPQPNHPFHGRAAPCGHTATPHIDFVQADALDYLDRHRQDFDAIHASPPCQRFSKSSGLTQAEREAKFPDLLTPTRQALARLPLPWVIENVPGAPMQPTIVLCGTMFGLRVYRHRYFESNRFLWQPPHPTHRARCARQGCYPTRPDQFMTVTGANHKKGRRWIETAGEHMGISWMGEEIGQAIPPAYTRYIGSLLLPQLSRTEAA